MIVTNTTEEMDTDMKYLSIFLLATTLILPSTAYTADYDDPGYEERNSDPGFQVDPPVDGRPDSNHERTPEDYGGMSDPENRDNEDTDDRDYNY